MLAKIGHCRFKLDQLFEYVVTISPIAQQWRSSHGVSKVNGKGKKLVPLAFGTPEHWRQRAKEARAMAEKIADPAAKEAMMAVAENYDRIAERAEAKLAAERSN